jgi:hypothetical protein
MKKVERNELLGLAEYEQIRQRFMARVIADKRDRRVLAGDELSLVFENHDTVLFQVQEMLRTERITKEAGILHELETYNDLIPGENELSATMFVEIPDAAVRERRLVELAGLESHIALEVLGTIVRGRNETRGVLPDRTTAVHYVKFPLGADLARRLVARSKESSAGAMLLVIDHPKLPLCHELPAAAVRALAEDLTPVVVGSGA